MELSLTDLEKLKENRESFYIYFSAPSCGVCEVLYPKLKELMLREFPKLRSFKVDNSKQPEIAAQLGLYTNPSLLVYMDGKEILSRSRVISLQEIENEISRTYSIMFE